MARIGLERFKPNRPGLREVLRSAGVRAELQARANRVKAEADRQLAGLDAPYPPTIADSVIGRNRASATVLGVPMPLERSRRILGGAIDAAGGP